MSNIETIRSYLVKLGFDVDNQARNKFDEALRTATAGIGKFAGTMTKDFAEAGAVVIGTLTGIATATVGMMVKTADSDLQFQLLARRMYMTVPAARSMQFALDALGVSIQDVVWGPPELRERYAQLIKDQRTLGAGLGGDFEGQMRHIRDIEFEFTRLRVEAQYFVMGLTKALSLALTGDENGLLKKLREWNEWLIKNIPDLANKFAAYLIPVLRDVKAIWADIADILGIVSYAFLNTIALLYGDPRIVGAKTNIEKFGYAFHDLSTSIRGAFDMLDKLMHWLLDHQWILVALGTLRGAWGGAALGSAAGPWGTAIGAVSGGIAGGYATSKILGGITGSASNIAPTPSQAQGRDIRSMIVSAARSVGVDPALALAIAQKESGMNPNAPRGAAGEYGMMQVMPQTFAAYGSGDPANLQNNLMASMRYLAHLRDQYHGNEYQMAKHYNGSGPAADAYASDVMNRASHITINVNVKTDASAQDIAFHVGSELKKLSQRQQVQAQRTFA